MAFEMCNNYNNLVHALCYIFVLDSALASCTYGLVNIPVHMYKKKNHIRTKKCDTMHVSEIFFKSWNLTTAVTSSTKIDSYSEIHEISKKRFN